MSWGRPWGITGSGSRGLDGFGIAASTSWLSCSLFVVVVDADAVAAVAAAGVVVAVAAAAVAAAAVVAAVVVVALLR